MNDFLFSFKKKLFLFRTIISENKKTTFKIILIVILVIATMFLRIAQKNRDVIALDEKKNSTTEKEEKSSEFYVDISGAVLKPGVYKISNKTRLFELIELAGGLSTEADLDSINQASFIKDGEKVLIPSKNEGISESGTQEVGSSTNSQSVKVNINSASKDQLMTIPGVGEVIAKRIIDYRTGNRFTKTSDIKNVKGIGDATFSKMESMIVV